MLALFRYSATLDEIEPSSIGARGARTRKNRCRSVVSGRPFWSVLDDGLSDNAGERVSGPVPRLSFWGPCRRSRFQSMSSSVSLAIPSRTQTICNQQKKDCVVPPSGDSMMVNHRQQSAHLIPGYGPRHIGQTVFLQHLDCRAQIVGNDTCSKAETQKDTKVTTQIPPTRTRHPWSAPAQPNEASRAGDNSRRAPTPARSNGNLGTS